MGQTLKGTHSQVSLNFLSLLYLETINLEIALKTSKLRAKKEARLQYELYITAENLQLMKFYGNRLK